MNLTSYDPVDIKQGLIEFLQSKETFADFNYEGSAISTLVDLLVVNDHYIAYMANMLATESFHDSAQLRANVVSHAAKLSYTPRSRTATTVVADILVTPAAVPTDFSIVASKGTVFINSIDGVSYQFVTTQDVILNRTPDNKFAAYGVELKQGTITREQFLYDRGTGFVEIQNPDIDTSTMRVYVRDSELSSSVQEYMKPTNIVKVDSNTAAFYLSENSSGLYQIEFGRTILGIEPPTGAVIEIEYILCEETHANGIKELFAATLIDGYANTTVTVNVQGYGGAERDDIERIRYVAPKIYGAQERAVRSIDYEGLVVRDFPFIRSVKVWGGEDNSPPRYGSVFLCLIPEDDFGLPDAVKRSIEDRMATYALKVVTPVVVDAIYIGISLHMRIMVNNKISTSTYTETEAAVSAAVAVYNNKLKTFEHWYNESEMTQDIKTSVPAIHSFEITKTIFMDVEPQTGFNARYEHSFLNNIKPKSVSVAGLTLDVLATSSTVVDDGNGVLLSRIDRSGAITEVAVGTVDYASGSLNFVVRNFGTDVMRLIAEPATTNVYSVRNNVVYIADVNIDPMG